MAEKDKDKRSRSVTGFLYNPQQQVYEIPEDPEDFKILFKVSGREDLEELFPFPDRENICLIVKAFRTMYDVFAIKIEDRLFTAPALFVKADPVDFKYESLTQEDIDYILSHVNRVFPWEVSA